MLRCVHAVLYRVQLAGRVRHRSALQHQKQWTVDRTRHGVQARQELGSDAHASAVRRLAVRMNAADPNTAGFSNAQHTVALPLRRTTRITHAQRMHHE